MSWQKELENLEKSRQWDGAISFMQGVIEKHVEDADVYLYMCYLLMNLLAWEEYDDAKHSYYANMLKNYFDVSYTKFCHNPEYLYYMAHIAVMSPWFLGLDDRDYLEMFQRARALEPNNMLYQSNYYLHLHASTSEQKKEVEDYAALILQESSPIQAQLSKKGRLGLCLLGRLSHWAKKVLDEA